MAYKKLDPKFKAKWLKALRSGKYEQTSYRLRRLEDNSVGYCCLGVACDIIDPKAWDNQGGWRGLCTESTATLGFVTRKQGALLSRKNDQGESFTKIADWIEKNL